jgi:pilus assembly protein Flp/PilA
MQNKIRRMIAEQSGQDLVEYALLAAVVAIGSVAALSAFSTVITTAWTSISAMLSN